MIAKLSSRMGLRVAALAAIASVGVVQSAFAQRLDSPNPLQGRIGVKSSRSLVTAGSFLENQGQWHEDARFLGRSRGLDTWLTDQGVKFDFYTMRRTETPVLTGGKNTVNQIMKSGHVVSMEFAGSLPSSTSRGIGELPGKVNYITPNSGVGTGSGSARVFGEARLQNLYSGVNARIYFDQGQPRYDLLVAPGADPNQIRMRFNGADRVRLSSSNAILLQLGSQEVSVGDLQTYQVVNGERQNVISQFSVAVDGTVRVQVGNYDRTKPLVIDPVVYSTLLGGNWAAPDNLNPADDIGFGIAVDQFNNAYVGGSTTVPTFPTSIGAYDETPVGQEGFITKFNTEGTDVIYSTLVGGTGADSVFAVAVGSDGSAYAGGSTLSTDLTAVSAAQGTNGGGQDGFVLKLNPAGTAATYLTYVGGAGLDGIAGLAIDSNGAAYVTGSTRSANLPVTGAAFQAARSGSQDGFVTKVNASGSSFDYCTYLGGNDTAATTDDDACNDIAVDSNGFAYVCGTTFVGSFPFVAGSYDTVNNLQDGFVAKLNQGGSALVYSTFLGGNSGDSCYSIDVDSAGFAYVIGQTQSFNFPKTAGAFDTSYNLGTDNFLTKVNLAGNALVYSTFLRTSSGPAVNKVRIDNLGQAHIVGSAASTSTIPVTANADNATGRGGVDAFVLVMNGSGTNSIFCSWYGGSLDDGGFSIALDGARNAYITGLTRSCVTAGQTPFPTTAGAYREALPPDNTATTAWFDAFAMKIKTRIPLTIQALTVTPNQIVGGESATGTITLSGPASTGGALVTFTSSNPSLVPTPASFVIPAGSNTQNFTVNTLANVTDVTTVQLRAFVEGDSKTATLTIGPMLTTLTLSNSTVVGGNVVTGRVTLFKVATGPISVNLNSTDPAVASVPATVTVPAGTDTVTFDVTTTGVSSPVTVDISASFAGLTRTQSLTVLPANLASIVFDPAQVSGGTTSSCTVSLDGAAPAGGVTVALSASDPAATVPPSVDIPAGSRSVTFDVPTAVVTTNTNVVVTGTYNSVSVNGSLDVLVTDLISFSITPNSVLGGNQATGTVGINVPAASGGVVIQLAAISPLGAPVSLPPTVVVPAGATTADFTIDTFGVTADVDVTIEATYGTTQLQAVLQVRQIRFTLTLNPTSVPGGNTSIGTITLDEAAPTGGVDFDLASSNTNATVPLTVSVAEGQTVTTFAVDTVPVAADETADISASVAGGTPEVATLDILGARPLSLVLNPTSVPGGFSSTGTVTLSGPAPAGGATVTLSSNAAAATVPPSIVIPQGQTTGTFTVNTTAVAGTVQATITASRLGTDVSADLTITSAQLLNFTINPNRLRGGLTATGTITLTAAAPPGGAVITITNTNTRVWSVTSTTVTVPAGQTTFNFAIVTNRVSRTQTTQITAQYQSVQRSAVLTVTR